jgi:hypothetical protein
MVLRQFKSGHSQFQWQHNDTTGITNTVIQQYHSALYQCHTICHLRQCGQRQWQHIPNIKYPGFRISSRLSFAAPASVNYSASNIGSNVLGSFASASFSTTANITTGFGGSSTGPSMSVNNSYSTGTLTLTTALGNTALYKSGICHCH